MKWKSDSIQQFIKYKILYQQQSFALLKNYHSQKKHNQQIDSLYQQLNRYRLQQTYFQAQLLKLSTLSDRQITTNNKEAEAIGKKIFQLNENINIIKNNQTSSHNHRKKQLEKTYSQKIIHLTQLNKLQQTQMEQEINNFIIKIRKLSQEFKQKASHKNIDQIRKQIRKKQEQMKIIRNKKDQIKKLDQKYEQLKQKYLKRKQLIKKIRKQQEQKNEQKIYKYKEQVMQINQRLQEFSFQFWSLFNFQLLQSKITEESLKLDKKTSNKYYSNNINKIKQNQNKRSNFYNLLSKYGKQEFNQQEFSQSLKQYMENLSKNSQFVKKYIKNKKLQLGLQIENFQNLKKKQQQNEYSSSFKRTQQFNVDYLTELKELRRKIQNDKQNRKFHEILFFQPQFNEPYNYKNEIENIQMSIKKIQGCSQQFKNRRLKQIQQKQRQINKKQAILDKQIIQLESKVAKTEIQISKKSKINP